MRRNTATTMSWLGTVGMGLVFCAGACGLGPGPTQPDPHDPVADDGREFTLTAIPPPDPERCAEIEEDAASLLASTMECAAPTVCESRSGAKLLEDACLPALACYVAVSTEVDLAPIIDELAALDAQYRQACGYCPVPRCLDPTEVGATCREATCELTVDPDARLLASR